MHASFVSRLEKRDLCRGPQRRGVLADKATIDEHRDDPSVRDVIQAILDDPECAQLPDVVNIWSNEIAKWDARFKAVLLPIEPSSTPPLVGRRRPKARQRRAVEDIGSLYGATIELAE